MPSVTIILSDTPTGDVSIRTDFVPAIGKPCSLAQSQALEIISRTRRQLGIKPDIEAAATADTAAALQAIPLRRNSDIKV